MDGAMIQHKGLAESGRWAEMPFAQQMANIGSEVFRAGKWKEKEKTERAQNAADRALELLDFTVSARTKAHDKYASTNDSLNKYFDPFSMKAARQRHK